MHLRLICESLFSLLRTEWELHLHKDRPLYALLEGATDAKLKQNGFSSDEICHAMDVACLLYIKRVMCLQHSVAVTMLLRKNGHYAEVVIGAEIAQASFHAWAEMNGRVLNDKPYVHDLYRELYRC